MKAAVCNRIKTSIPYVKAALIVIIYFAIIEASFTMGALS